MYAIVLHAPINPIFRGRRAAFLSMLGFALMIGTLIAVQFGSGGSRADAAIAPAWTESHYRAVRGARAIGI